MYLRSTGSQGDASKSLCWKNERSRWIVRTIYKNLFSIHIIDFCSVVTGVRFKEDQSSIFLQIQVGKLLPMGLVDAETITWLKIPSYADENFATIKYDDILSSTILLGSSHLKFNKNIVVTGECYMAKFAKN